MKCGTTIVALATLVVAAACSADLNQPVGPDGISTAKNPPSAPSYARNGSVHVEKECSTYAGRAGDICTITQSNVKDIEVGSTVHYLIAANLGTLTYDGAVVLDPPGPGNNAAAGHCTVNLATGTGVCLFSGGTGKFTFFSARVDVTPLGGVVYAWDGWYRYGQ